MGLLDKFFKDKEPETVEIKGKLLICPHCQNDKFWHERRLLNTAGATAIGFDWANKQAHCFVCSDCTHISWFLGE